jgi:hypothetical protein
MREVQQKSHCKAREAGGLPPNVLICNSGLTEKGYSLAVRWLSDAEIEQITISTWPRPYAQPALTQTK